MKTDRYKGGIARPDKEIAMGVHRPSTGIAVALAATALVAGCSATKPDLSLIHI